MSTSTPGCGSNSETRKREAAKAENAAHTQGEIAAILTENLNLVAPLRHIFGEPGQEMVDALEVLLAQEVERVAHILAAREAAAEKRGRVGLFRDVSDALPGHHPVTVAARARARADAEASA